MNSKPMAEAETSAGVIGSEEPSAQIQTSSVKSHFQDRQHSKSGLSLSGSLSQANFSVVSHPYVVQQNTEKPGNSSAIARPVSANSSNLQTIEEKTLHQVHQIGRDVQLATKTAENDSFENANPNQKTTNPKEENKPQESETKWNLHSLFQFLNKLNFDLSSSVDLGNGSEQVLNRISSFFNADFSALVGTLSQETFSAARKGSVKIPKIIATSCTSSIDQSGQLSQTLADCVQRCVRLSAEEASEKQNAQLVFDLATDPASHPLFSLLDSRHLTVILISNNPNSPLALFLGTDTPIADGPDSRKILDAVPALLNPICHNLSRIHQSGWSRILKWPTVVARTNWKTITAAAFAVIGICLLPVPYTLNCQCSLHPATRRFAVAPFDGKLKEVVAKPGENVRQGDLLAKMDDQELRLQLNSLQSDLAKERQVTFASKAAGELGKARISELKGYQLQNEIKLVKHKLEKIEIRANISGTIVQGKIEHLTGAPVEIGQNLLEVAPLESLIVKVEIPEYQIRYVKPGQNVRLMVEAYPYQSWESTVLRIQPQAVIRQHQNVFLADVELKNTDYQLQPGMKGKAKIVSDSYPLAWNWLHYPYEKLRFVTGWF